MKTLKWIPIVKFGSITLLVIISCCWVLPNLLLLAFVEPPEKRAVEVSSIESPDGRHVAVTYRDPGLNATTPTVFMVVSSKKGEADSAQEVFRGYGCAEDPRTRTIAVTWISNDRLEIGGSCTRILRSVQRYGPVTVSVR